MNKTTSLNLNHGKLLLNGMLLSSVIFFMTISSSPSIFMDLSTSLYATKAEIMEEIRKSLVGEGEGDPLDSIVIGKPKLGGGNTGRSSRAGRGKAERGGKSGRGGQRSSSRRAGKQR